MKLAKEIILQARQDFILKKHKRPTEAFVHPNLAIDLISSLNIVFGERVFGLRLILDAERDYEEPLLTWSEDRS